MKSAGRLLLPVVFELGGGRRPESRISAATGKHTHTHTIIVFVRLPNCVSSYVCRARTYAIQMYVYCAGSTVFRRSSFTCTQHRTRCLRRRQAPRHDLNTTPERSGDGPRNRLRTRRRIADSSSSERLIEFTDRPLVKTRSRR